MPIFKDVYKLKLIQKKSIKKIRASFDKFSNMDISTKRLVTE